MKSVKRLLPQVTELVFLPTCQFPPFESPSQLHQREVCPGTPAAPAPRLHSEPPSCCPRRASLTDAAAPPPGLAPSSLPWLLRLVQTSCLAGTPGALRGGALLRVPLGDQRAGVCWGGDCPYFSLPTESPVPWASTTPGSLPCASLSAAEAAPAPVMWL